MRCKDCGDHPAALAGRQRLGGLDEAIYPWGDELTPGGADRCHIWQGAFPWEYAGTRPLGTAPVRTFRPNGFGLFQTVGNVWEWTADPWSVDGQVDTAQRVRRGGSYLCHDSYCNRYRVAARDHSALGDATGTLNNIGDHMLSNL